MNVSPRNKHCCQWDMVCVQQIKHARSRPPFSAGAEWRRCFETTRKPRTGCPLKQTSVVPGDPANSASALDNLPKIQGSSGPAQHQLDVVSHQTPETDNPNPTAATRRFAVYTALF